MIERHHSARLSEISKLYAKVGERTYTGPQGPELSAFLEEACELDILRRCNLQKYDSRNIVPEVTKEYFIVKPHYGRAEPSSHFRKTHSITDTLELTEKGEIALQSGCSNPEVYRLVLRCGGGTYRGKTPSGSNCIRVPSRPGWCSGIGQCEDSCVFLTQSQMRNRLDHMCNFTVFITATLCDIKNGRRKIHIEGDHGYPDSKEWKPPNICRPTVRVRENAIKIGVSVKGPSASNVLAQCVNSPGGKTSRSYMDRAMYYKSVENYRRALQVQGSGPYHRVDVAIRSFIYPKTNELATSGRPFIINYKGGISTKTMEITVVTTESLLWLRQLGLERVVSDSRWFGGRFCKTCATCILAVNPEIKYGVTGAIQFSSTESQETIKNFIEAIRVNIPCGDDCNHGFTVHPSTVGYVVRRECSNNTVFNPRVIIDKSASAKAGIEKADCSVGVDLYHHHQSFTDNLKGKGIFPDTAAATAVDRFHRLRLRARSQEAIDFIIEEMINFIHHISPDENLRELDEYIKSSLGYRGSPWEGCIGDIAQIEGHPIRNTSTNCAEGHHFAVQYCLNSGVAEVQIDKTIIDRTLGLTGMGMPSQELTYFSYFSEGYKERLSQAKRQPRKLLTPREKRTKYEGLFIAWKALHSLFYENGHNIVEQCTSQDYLYFVRRGLPKILSCSISTEGLREKTIKIMPQVEELRGIVNFGPSIEAIIPSGIIIRDNHYTVNTMTRSCYTCEFWITHGSGTVQCKHIHAAEAYRDAIDRLNEGMSKEDTMAIIENDLCLYIQNRERSKRKTGNRDEIFLRGNNQEILNHLKSGAISTLDSAHAVSISSVLDPVMEKYQAFHNRRNCMKDLETNENTCRSCHVDDTAAMTWIGCDHEPRCLGGAGWYHMKCVGLVEEPEGSWICDLCKEDDHEVEKLNSLVNDSDEKALKLPVDDAFVKQISCKAGIILNNCTVMNNVILFLNYSQEISREFSLLGIQLHDIIENITIANGKEWEPFDGTINDLTEDDMIQFSLRRNSVRKNSGPTSRELLSLSSDAREVGCARDTYYKVSELPAWLSADAARPSDVQRVRKRGIRHTNYANPNARKVTRSSKRKLTDNTNLVCKSAILALNTNIKPCK